MHGKKGGKKKVVKKDSLKKPSKKKEKVHQNSGTEDMEDRREDSISPIPKESESKCNYVCVKSDDESSKSNIISMKSDVESKSKKLNTVKSKKTKKESSSVGTEDGESKVKDTNKVKSKKTKMDSAKKTSPKKVIETGEHSVKSPDNDSLEGRPHSRESMSHEYQEEIIMSDDSSMEVEVKIVEETTPIYKQMGSFHDVSRKGRKIFKKRHYDDDEDMDFEISPKQSSSGGKKISPDKENTKRARTQSTGPSQCVTCAETGSQKSMVQCDNCEQWYHLQCLDPPCTRTPKQRGYTWFCEACDVSDESEEEEVEEKS